jgi:hypothetical protein
MRFHPGQLCLKGARAWLPSIVCAVFAAFALIHLLWAVGITWGLKEVSAAETTPDAGLTLTAISLAAAAVGAAASIVTLGRVGWLKTRLSNRVLHLGNWLVFAWPAIGSLNPATTWGQRTVALPLTIAALIIALWHTHGRTRAKRHGLRSRAHPSLTEP